MTAWQRLPLTAAVLAHYARLRGAPALAAAHVRLGVHVAGSGGAAVAAVAAAAGATYSEHPNTPLGAKHVAGLAAGRSAHPATDGVVVVGSDDLLPAAYLVAVAGRLRGGRSHLVGLADLGVVDLGDWDGAYSAGYRRGANPVASTVGLGRAYSAALLDALAPRGGLWEAALRRGLDQSAARRLLVALPAVVSVADVLVGGGARGDSRAWMSRRATRGGSTCGATPRSWGRAGTGQVSGCTALSGALWMSWWARWGGTLPSRTCAPFAWLWRAEGGTRRSWRGGSAQPKTLAKGTGGGGSSSGEPCATSSGSVGIALCVCGADALVDAQTAPRSVGGKLQYVLYS